MDIKSIRTRNGKILYAGSLKSHEIIFFINRSNYNKTSNTIQSIMKLINSYGFCIAWYENNDIDVYYFLNQEYEKFSKNTLLTSRFTTNNIIRKYIKSLILIKNPSLWKHFFSFLKPKDTYLHDFREVIRYLGYGKSIYILSHSAGGLLSSLIEDEKSIRKSICFGYPFKSPQKGFEPHRTQHLAGLKKPLLIIQGRNDEYGGEEINDLYQFSPQIRLMFIDSDHNYQDIDATERSRIEAQIFSFLDLPIPRPTGME